MADNIENRPVTGKKTYRQPELTSYGDVSRITRGGNGASNDTGGSGTHTMVCWVAEVLYGIDAPRTHLVRAWLTDCYEQRVRWALFVVPIYRRFGRNVAELVRSHRIVQRLLRPVFDHAVTCAHRDFASRIADRLA